MRWWARSRARPPRTPAAQEPARRLQAHEGRPAGVEILDELRDVNAHRLGEGLAGGRRGRSRVAARAAQAAANAAKEGGFMGFHAERVSEGEQRMLDSLGEALASPA